LVSGLLIVVSTSVIVIVSANYYNTVACCCQRRRHYHPCILTLIDGVACLFSHFLREEADLVKIDKETPAARILKMPTATLVENEVFI
jgi:hypothetical protein